MPNSLRPGSPSSSFFDGDSLRAGSASEAREEKKAPVGYVRKAPEEIRSQFLIRSFSGSRPSREVLKTSAEAFDSQISAGDFGELLRRLRE
ncbi:hypothetical protein CROQUDRAFT_91627, partial [Cronartium quercuum f. sp. fusiforme G11]